MVADTIKIPSDEEAALVKIDFILRSNFADTKKLEMIQAIIKTLNLATVEVA